MCLAYGVCSSTSVVLEIASSSVNSAPLNFYFLPFQKDTVSNPCTCTASCAPFFLKRVHDKLTASGKKMLRNPRVLQARLSHFRSPKLAPPLLHHYHGLLNSSIPAALIHQPFGKRYGVARHSSSNVVKPSEGDIAIGNGMRLHVTNITEWQYPDSACPEEGVATLRTYANELLRRDDQPIMASQSALVTRLYTPPYQTSQKLTWTGSYTR